jgi:hypothetical protein
MEPRPQRLDVICRLRWGLGFRLGRRLQAFKVGDLFCQRGAGRPALLTARFVEELAQESEVGTDLRA